MYFVNYLLQTDVNKRVHRENIVLIGTPSMERM